jgi:aryl-alcohol dehydrogenase-like predicted oxidoreductase
MDLNELGNTGISVSPVTIGAWQLGGPLFFDGKPDGHPDPGKANVIRMIHELGDLGVNAIDTAEQYSAGESERRVGEALKGRRDQWSSPPSSATASARETCASTIPARRPSCPAWKDR